MNNQNYEGFTNITVFDLFLVLFVGLKLAGIINWSWWWVLSPISIPVGLIIIGYLLAAIFIPFYNKEKK